MRGKPRATRQRTTPGFRARRSPAPPARRKLRATGAGETPGHPVLGKLWGLWSRGEPGATRQEGNPQGGTSGHWRREDFEGMWRRGNPESGAEKKALGHWRREDFEGMWRRGNPESGAEKKALGHRRRENFKLCGGGETPSCVMRRKLLATRRRENLSPLTWGKPRSFGEEKALSHWCGKYLAPPGLGETPARWQRGKPEPRRGEHPSHPVIRSTGTPAAFLALVGGRAAQRTLRNRRDGAARLGEAPPSHTWRGLVLCLPCLVPLCPTGQNRARTDTPPPPFPVAAAGGSALAVQFAGADVASRPPWAGLAPLAGSRAGRAGRQAARVDGGAGPGQCPVHRRAAIVRQGSGHRVNAGQVVGVRPCLAAGDFQVLQQAGELTASSSVARSVHCPAAPAQMPPPGWTQEGAGPRAPLNAAGTFAKVTSAHRRISA